jgi:signal peptidase I
VRTRFAGRLEAFLVTCILVAAAAGAARGAAHDSAPSQVDASTIATKLASVGVYAQPGDREFSIPAASMEPTLHCAAPGVQCLANTADRILVRPYGASRPARGDIVAFHTPPGALVRCGVGGVFLKRIIGLPGERWSERDGFVYIDGERIAEPYIPRAYRDDFTYGVRTIPAGRYFVLGDNRPGSCDSRRWGSVPRRNIIGKAIAIYWPPSRVRRL